MLVRDSLRSSSKTIYTPPAVTLQKGDILFVVGDSNVGHIQKYCAKNYQTSVKFLPLSGHLIQGILNWAQHQVQHNKKFPQKLILQCGTVNILNYHSPLSISSSLTFLLIFFKFHAPTMQIAFVSLPLTSRFNANQIIKSINNTFKIICGIFGVSFVNTYPVFSGNGRFNTSSLQKDGIHLSEGGCEKCVTILKDHFTISGSLN